MNDELAVLDGLLQQAPDGWNPMGCCVISFHLEDRRVKTAFKEDERLRRITRKPVVATNGKQRPIPQPQCQMASGAASGQQSC